MIVNRLSILQGLFGPFRGHPGAAAARMAAAEAGQRWRAARGRYPQLAADLAQLGGLFVAPPVDMAGGAPEPPRRDPYQCGRDDGRRELALQLLALMGLTQDDLNLLMEDDDVE